MGAPILGPEKTFNYEGAQVKLRWEMDAFSGSLQLVQLIQPTGCEWWIVNRLGPFFSTALAKSHPGGAPAYLKDVLVPAINADIAKLVSKAKADNARDPVNGQWASTLDQLTQLLLRSVDVRVEPGGTWWLASKY